LVILLPIRNLSQVPLVEATAYFEEGWIITEKHITISRPCDGVSTYLEVAMDWSQHEENIG
jgi:hypothetical protein